MTGRSWLRRICFKAYNLASNLRLGGIGSRIRVYFLGKCIGGCGKNVYVGRNVCIVSPCNLTLGSNISIHDGCYIDASGDILIKDDVSIAHDCSILSANHTYKDLRLPIRNNPLSLAPVVIERDCWLGCKVVVLPKVTISTRTIVAAGGIVTKTFPSNVIIGGNPAKMIKEI